MWASPFKLADLLELAARGNLPSGWLYLPKDWRTWNADTSAYMLDISDENYDSIETEAEERDYASTIESEMVKDVVRDVHSRLRLDSFAARVEALKYYHRFDNVLPRIGAPDPPPPEEQLLQMDRHFYDSLGEERSDAPCRAAGCTRGAVKFSVLCRTHHFEQVYRRACPFRD